MNSQLLRDRIWQVASWWGASRRGRVAAVVGGLMVVYVLAAALLVPWVLRRQLVGFAREELRREATLAKARFNPFTLEARLIGLALRDHDGTPLLAFDTLAVNVSLGSLPARALVLDEFRLVRPVAVARIAADGRPALADLFVRDSSRADSTNSGPASIPRLKVHQLLIRTGRLEFIDESRKPQYAETLDDLGLDLEGLSTLANDEGGHLLTVSLASGAELRWTGTVAMQPLQLAGKFVLSRLRLPRIANLFGDRIPITLVRGEGAVAFDYSVEQAGDGSLQFTVPDAAINLRDLVARPQGADSDWVRVPHLEVQGLRALWPQRVVNVKLVQIHRPWLAAVRGADGSIDWATQLAPFLAADSTSPSDTASPWHATVAEVVVDSGEVRLRDRSVSPETEFVLERVGLRLGPLSTDPGFRTGIQASAGMGGGSAFSASGGLTREPLAGDLDVAIEQVDLSRFQPYLGSSAPAIIASASASLRGKTRLREKSPRLAFDGQAALEGVVVTTPAQESLLSWRRASIGGIRFSHTPDLLRIRNIDVDHPFARIAVSRDRQLNLAPLATMTSDTTSSRETFPYEILKVTLSDAQVDFSDESLILPFRTRVHSATGTLSDIASFGGTPGALAFEGRIDEIGMAQASGTLHVGDPFAATTIRADFRSVEMARLSPYTVEFLGYGVSRGRLDVDLTYQIQNRALKADHHIVASDLTLGDKVEGGAAPGFLVKLAVSLLKDREGKIKMDALVEGTVDEPDFSYKAIVWGAIKQALGKIASAPFRFLGKLLGLGDDDIELVDFDPGRADIFPQERAKLDSLAAEMGRRPELRMSIEGRFDSIADVAAIRESRLQVQIEARRDSAGRHAAADTGTTVLATIFESLYVEQFSRASFDSLRAAFIIRPVGDSAPVAGAGRNRKAPKGQVEGTLDAPGFYTALRDNLLTAQPVSAADLVALGRSRGEGIATALAAGGTLDPARIKVTDPAPVSRKKAGSSRVASEMSLDAE